MKRQDGFVDEAMMGITAVLGVILVLSILTLPWLRVEWSEDNVSGVVYNNTNNAWPSGNTGFSVRASEDSLVTEENRSSYCLPPGSPYIDLVNEAATNKTIKVSVKTAKAFTFVPAPWTCLDNVTVERVQK